MINQAINPFKRKLVSSFWKFRSTLIWRGKDEKKIVASELWLIKVAFTIQAKDPIFLIKLSLKMDINHGSFHLKLFNT